MSYQGVKYRSIITNHLIPSDPRIDELRFWCAVFHEKDLAPHYDGGTHGNMSFRTKAGEDSFVITAAKTGFDKPLSDDSFFTVLSVDLDQMKVYASGSPFRQPSSESMLHAAIYQKRPDVQAILHGHCQSITKNSEKAGIPTTAHFVESGNLVIVESVMEILDGHRFIEIRDHGFMAMAPTIAEAGKLSMEMLDKSLKFL